MTRTLAILALLAALAGCRATIEPEPLVTIDVGPSSPASVSSGPASALLRGPALIRALREKALRLPEDSPRRRELVLMQRNVLSAQHECEIAPPHEASIRQQTLADLVVRANSAIKELDQ